MLHNAFKSMSHGFQRRILADARIDDFGFSMIEHLSVFHNTVHDIWAHQFAIVGNGVVKVKHIHAWDACLVAIADLSERNLAPSGITDLAVTRTLGTLELYIEVQVFEDLHLINEVEITLRITVVSTCRKLGKRDVGRLHHGFVGCHLAHRMVVAYLLAMIIP